MSLNKVLLLGRLGADPELKFTPNGNAVCNFSMATSKKFKDKNGNDQEITSWHRVVVWGKLAELTNQYMSKGKQCLVEGEINYRSWDDKDGVKKYTTEINATHIQFIGSSEPDTQGGNKKGGGTHSSSPDFKPEVNDSFADESIPF